MSLEYWLSPKAVRDSAQKVFDYTKQGKGHFQVQMDKLIPCVNFVMEVIRENYPNLDIPFHSRLGHFRAGKINRIVWLEDNESFKIANKLEKARILWDLIIPSVLLDAGAGAEWKYFEEKTKQFFTRSEGLGVASFHMFLAGVFSKSKSLKTDSAGLQKISSKDIENFFQVSESNPLVGVEGRVTLLKNLGKALENPKYFKEGRPGNLIDYLIEKYPKGFNAENILHVVLSALGPIWPGRENFEGTNLGDVWKHSHLGLIAFHKLSQWMTYSLIEPLLDAGLNVSGVELLTGLPEYRNGGLFLDMEVLRFKDKGEQETFHTPESDVIIEWRALTVYLLDCVGLEVQKKLGKTSQEFPLAKVLEGGTWWAGRRIAAQKRTGGTPPLNIISDGTVF
jgi:hypothetical protein